MRTKQRLLFAVVVVGVGLIFFITKWVNTHFFRNGDMRAFEGFTAMNVLGLIEFSLWLCHT